MSSSNDDWIQRIRKQKEAETKAAADKILKDEQHRVESSDHFQRIQSILLPKIRKHVESIQQRTGVQVETHVSDPTITLTIQPSEKSIPPRLGTHSVTLKAVPPSRLHVVAEEDWRIDRGPMPEDSDMSFRDWYGPSGSVLSETLDASSFSEYDIDLLLEWLTRTELERKSPGRPRLSSQVARDLNALNRVRIPTIAGFILIAVCLLLLVLGEGTTVLFWFLGAPFVGFAYAKWKWSQGQPADRHEFKQRFWTAFILGVCRGTNIFVYKVC